MIAHTIEALVALWPLFALLAVIIILGLIYSW